MNKIICEKHDLTTHWRGYTITTAMFVYNNKKKCNPCYKSCYSVIHCQLFYMYTHLVLCWLLCTFWWFSWSSTPDLTQQPITTSLNIGKTSQTIIFGSFKLNMSLKYQFSIEHDSFYVVILTNDHEAAAEWRQNFTPKNILFRITILLPKKKMKPCFLFHFFILLLPSSPRFFFFQPQSG